jgi:hypothetical protein
MTQIDGELFDSKENIEIVQSSQVINLLINKNTFLLQK